MEDQLPTILQWNLGINIASLSLFLVARKHSLFLKCHDFIQYLWALQVLVFLLPSNYVDVRAKIFLSYGFGFDFMILEVSASSASANEIMFRFATNLIHHLTLLDTTIPVLRVAYLVCWLTHLFPWLRLCGKMEWFKTIATCGNMAPVVALLWLMGTGEYDTTLSEVSRAILLMMVAYRGLFINSTFHVFSRCGILSKHEEAAFQPVVKRMVVATCLLAIAHFYCPSILATTVPQLIATPAVWVPSILSQRQHVFAKR